ncbi:MAG: hypothetical protein E6R04_04430 [Spirochaetes bacterium]|nr:MAG: hypothetical protein E6R04_04430 [Spirochaetota bacterium]
MTVEPREMSYTNDGYPTVEGIAAVQNFSGTPHGFVELLREVWSHEDLVSVHDTDGGVMEIRCVTVGWSGNEELISAIEESMFGLRFWESSHRGGLHVYHVPNHLWFSPFVNQPFPPTKTGE